MRLGVKELLETVSKNKRRLANATSTIRDNVDLLLKSCLNKNPEGFFSFISIGELVKKKKPSPDLFKLVLSEMKLELEECLALEDSRMGLISAKGANLKIAVNQTY